MQVAEPGGEGPGREAHHRLVGEVADQVLHDLANRLAVARMTAEVLAARADLPADLAATVAAMVSSTDGGAQVVQRLSVLAGRRPGPPHAVDLGIVVAELRPLLGAALGPRLELAEPVAAPVVADRLVLEEIVLRLVLGGRRRAEGPVEVKLTVEGATVLLVVSRPVGDPLHASALARARELAMGAGGSVVGDVRDDGGADTTLRLSRAAGVGSAPRPAEETPSVDGARVLVVEDDPDLRALVRSALEADGHRVWDVVDADAALAHPLVLEGALDLLVTDVELPGRSGLELAARLVAQGIRVLVMSGHGAAGLGAAVPAGVLVLDKPFGVPGLRARAREALAQEPV